MKKVSMMGKRLHWAAWLMRRADLDGNPLRRPSDRAEAWIRLSLVIVFLVAGPLAAIAVGHWANDSGVSAARAQAAADHRVRAVLLGSTPTPAGYPAAGSSVAAWVPARWTAPDGASRRGDVWAPAGTRAGSVVTVWTDASGTLVDPPIGHAQVISRVISLVAVTPAALAVLLLTVLLTTRRVLDRRRLAAWEMGWTTVEPQWTRRGH
jgi:hypothetical protein